MKVRRWKSERGNVMVEFAMVLPIFLLVVWGVVDFARAFYTSNSLATAVREGARFAAVREWKSPAATAAQIAASRDSVKMKVKASFIPFGGPAIDTTKVVVTFSDAQGTVTVEDTAYDWTTSTPLNVIPGGTIKMKKKAVFRWERQITN
ncbi:MAG: TadE family protein [Gemmatimonadales bacterium]